MPYGILSCYCVLLVSCFVAIEAKIVYLNGTEIPDDNLKIVNATTKQPVQRWFSVFNPRNISNHSGTKTKVNLPTFNRKHDHDAQEEEKIEEAKIEENNTFSNNTLSTRSGRQMRLFYMQRLLNGMHLLALLGGIYLMIFVVEPVAVPHEYLAQHFYGLPWSADRRHGLHRDRLESIPLLQRKNFLTESLAAHRRKESILNDAPKYSRPRTQFQQHRNPAQNVKVANVLPVHSNKNSTALTGTTRVKYISAQNFHLKPNVTTLDKVQTWSKWIPSRNSTDKIYQKNGSNQPYWSPSLLSIQRSDVKGKNTEKKVFNSTGSASSIRLSEVLH